MYRSRFLTTALVEASFTPRPFYPDNHWVRGRLGTKAGLDMERRKFLTLRGLKLRPLGRPTRMKYRYKFNMKLFTLTVILDFSTVCRLEVSSEKYKMSGSSGVSDRIVS
jgi:hypothetical protein